MLYLFYLFSTNTHPIYILCCKKLLSITRSKLCIIDRRKTLSNKSKFTLLHLIVQHPPTQSLPYLSTLFNVSIYLSTWFNLSLYFSTLFNVSIYLSTLFNVSIYLSTGFNVSLYLSTLFNVSFYLSTWFNLSLYIIHFVTRLQTLNYIPLTQQLLALSLPSSLSLALSP